jgi:hypothetical protein
MVLFLTLLAAVCAAAQEDTAGLAGPNEPLDLAVPGPLAAPLPSPDGRYLAFTGPSFEGLWLLDLQQGGAFRLSDQKGAGFRAAWSPDGRSLAYRSTVGSSNPRQLVVVVHPDGVKEVASPLLESASLPSWRGPELCYFSQIRETLALKRVGPKTEAAEGRALPAATPEGRLLLCLGDGACRPVEAPEEKVYFLPVVSPDGCSFVCECLDGHLYLGSTDGGLLKDLGPGAWPSFVRKGASLLFERTSDDGHQITGGDLFLMDLSSLEPKALTNTPALVERRPALAPDGHTLYYEAEGRIYRGWLP